MITTYKEYREWLTADLQRSIETRDKNMFLERVKGNLVGWNKYRLIKTLRFCEFLVNKRSFLSLLLYRLWYKRKLAKLQMKTQLFISPNTCGKGLDLEHPGFVWIDGSSQLGENCTVLPRTLLGKSRPGMSGKSIFIGDNVYIGTGCTILGPVRIGNNVIIGAGSVITHNIPSNCVVAGVPAKIIKRLS